MIAHQLPAQSAHHHTDQDELAACEWEHEAILTRLAEALAA